MAPIENCGVLEKAMGVLMCVAAAATLLLFLLRVRAVYLNSAAATAGFGVLWATAVGCVIVQSSNLSAAHAPQTQYCVRKFSDTWLLVASIAASSYDTAVFAAISYRLAADGATARTWRARARSILQGRGLYSVSRALMRSGQVYYLASIVFFLANLAVIFSPGVPMTSHYLFAPAQSAFTNLMACCVFRGVALGVIEGTPADLSTMEITAALQTKICVDDANVDR
ncbi:hypothetical protein HWV62_23729 [Athelia sp. TMB]|nr:hypothetical protein HWV62_23729 [Athelia sp. TMB]